MMANGEIILKLIKDVTGIELEIGENFLIGDDNYVVRDDGLFYVGTLREEMSELKLQKFLDRLPSIQPKPKFPKDDTKYYCISKDNHIYEWVFSKYITNDVLNYKTGNFFLTYEEAEQNKEKIMKILNSPERFELK